MLEYVGEAICQGISAGVATLAFIFSFLSPYVLIALFLLLGVYVTSKIKKKGDD